MSFKEICEELPRLKLQELREIERLTHELAEDAFDRALEAGAQGGKFDKLKAEAEAEIAEGKF